jgi:hypothetical protein
VVPFSAATLEFSTTLGTALFGASYPFPFEALKLIPAVSLPLSATNAAPPFFKRLNR